ncbi:MAG: AAA family ATPase, partial [Candidatus Omnitrophota bacterium]
EVLEEVEEAILRAFVSDWYVDLEGSSGAGKTSIAREIALLLGLPGYAFQMHGEREITDIIGSYREDNEGNVCLSNRPLPVSRKETEKKVSPALLRKLTTAGILTSKDKGGKFEWATGIYTNIDLGGALQKKLPDLEEEEKGQIISLLHYRQPLLEFLTHGGVFIADEGAIGEKGRDLLSWFSRIVSGDEVISLHEFPGHELRVKVHPDFFFIITNNLPEETCAREPLRSEIASNMQAIYVDEDESEDTLKRLFLYFLGEDVSASLAQRTEMANLVAKLHLTIKPRIGKDLGKDNKDRHHISKREVRRIARQMRSHLKENPESDGTYAFYKACRIVYEAVFSHREERDEVVKMVHNLLAKSWPMDTGRSYKELNAEILSRFGASATDSEAWVEWVADELLRQDEPVLFISEYGARTRDMLKYVTDSRDAELSIIDAAPEHTELEILGGLLPHFGDRHKQKRRSRFARGSIARHLLRKEDLERLKASGLEGQKERIVWIRNIDQWDEDIRTALNGLLEDGYIDIETDDGRIERFYKDPRVRFVSEISSETARSFSSAFFNRWIRIGVSSELPVLQKGKKTSEFEEVLTKVYELDNLEALYLNYIYKAALRFEEKGIWKDSSDYNISPEIFYAIAESISLAKRENPEWQLLLEDIARAGYDPRAGFGKKPSSDEEKKLQERYLALVRTILIQEIVRIFGAQFSLAAKSRGEGEEEFVSDRQHFINLLSKVFKVNEIPGLDVSIVTEDGTLDTVVNGIGGIPIEKTGFAKAPAQVSAKHQVYYTPPGLRGLSAIARAESLSRCVVLEGMPGGIKTTLSGHYAEITGKRFYKYQTHAGSEYTDLTMDIEQTEKGLFRKRVKELYSYVKEGHVVIDIDEANISPRILWVLEPLIRGERIINPIFPEEEPFEVGEGVIVIFTINPSTFPSRKEIDRRLTDRMIKCQMDLPEKADKERIVQMFFGVPVKEAGTVSVSAGVFQPRAERTTGTQFLPVTEEPATQAEDKKAPEFKIAEELEELELEG